MPFITCDLEEGLTESEKQVLITKMTEITHRCIGSAMEHINIVLREHPASNIGEAGQAGRALISSRGKAARSAVA